MKNFYVVVQICENNKYYAYIVKATENDNLLAKLQIKNIITANICPTGKAARALVNQWNTEHRANNRYIFDTMPDGSPAPF